MTGLRPFSAILHSSNLNIAMLLDTEVCSWNVNKMQKKCLLNFEPHLFKATFFHIAVLYYSTQTGFLSSRNLLISTI